MDEAYPQIYNDWPAHLWPDHLPDDTEYETLTVSAGEFIGYADLRESNDFDIAVLREDGSQLYWVSFFDLLSDTVQDEYTSRGIVIENFIISKEARSSEPVTWWGGRNDDDWILFSPSIISLPWVYYRFWFLAFLSLVLLKLVDIKNYN